VDAAQGAAGLRQLGDASEDAGSKFKQLFAAGAAFAGVTAFIKSAVNAASDLQQSTGGVEAVFKSSASAVKNFASSAAQSLGLSKSAYQELATVIGSQLKNAGTSMEDLAPKTNSLIEKGADLAAMFGGTTAEAVGALSSALKGERDPIERYGVSLNQAAIDAEIMAQGMDTSTNAAKQAATQQATLNLIMKQTADSQGAAAREADSYASVMQQLNAVWENTIAEVGTALLPALSSLGQAFTDMMPLIGAVLTPISELLGWVLQLPTPILAAAAAFGAWTIFGGSITSGLGSFITKMKTATSTMGSFKSAMGGIASSLAGGLAFAGVSVAILLIAQAFQRTAQAAQTATQAYQPVVDALVASKGAWSDTAAEAQKAAILTSDAFKGLTEEGFKGAEATKILLGTQEEWIATQEQMGAAGRSFSKDTTAAVDSMIDANGAAAGLAQAQMEGAAAMNVNSTAAGGNAEATAAASEAQAKAAEEAVKSAAANTTLKTALASVQAAASSSAAAIDFFTLSMNKAAGRVPSVDEAAKLMNNTLRATATAFKGTAEDGGYSMAALTDWNVAALTSTERGSAIYDSLTQMQTAYSTATVTAYEQAAANGVAGDEMTAAASAADTAYAAFIAMATEATGSSVAAEQLAAKLGIVQGTQIDPKVFPVIAEDQQADAAVADLQAAQIDPKDVTVNATVTPAEGAFTALVRQELDNTVKVDADPRSAQSTVDGFTSTQRTTTPVKVTADPSPANATVNGFTQTQRSTQVQVTANATSALQTIGNVVNSSYSTTIQVGANTSDARNAIYNVANGSYTATIYVTANTSAARSAIASVPTVVSVGPAPQVSAMAQGAMAFGAPGITPAAPPPMHNVGALSVPPSKSVTYTINISNTLDSADSIARRVEAVISRRERRIHGIRVQPT
jgi:hypothetical protein